MEIERIVKTATKKSLLIVGGGKAKRKTLVNQLVSEIPYSGLYRFLSGLTTFDAYIKEVRKKFPFIPMSWNKPKPYWNNINRVWDFHLDWVIDAKNILITLEELDQMETNWKYAIINSYLTQAYKNERVERKGHICFRLILTFDVLEEGFFEQLKISGGVKEKGNRTEQEVIYGKLAIINLDGV